MATGQTFGRIYWRKHSDALGYAKTPSRFSDPRPRPEAERFGIVYLGSTLEVCFLEAVLRDGRSGMTGAIPIEEAELTSRLYAKVRVVADLRLVDLRSGGAVRIGAPTDVHGAMDHADGQRWSVAFHDHPDAPDGIVYPSRLNGDTNLAVYDRALPKLAADAAHPLIADPDLGAVLDKYDVSLI